jgi:hypothetical protein
MSLGRRLALNCHRATINYSYVLYLRSPTRATVGSLRFGIIAGSRHYLSIDRISRPNNCALSLSRSRARSAAICMRIRSLVTDISARDSAAAYLRDLRFSRDASHDINLPNESIYPVPLPILFALVLRGKRVLFYACV